MEYGRLKTTNTSSLPLLLSFTIPSSKSQEESTSCLSWRRVRDAENQTTPTNLTRFTVYSPSSFSQSAYWLASAAHVNKYAKAADGICSQETAQNNEVAVPIDIQVHGLSLGRRLFSGPGSSPPRCISKCGDCTPCKPVHVSVPPGTPVTAEYYPEAWRCKCGNKLYMP
ncbi:EPIDERMAL PATTERNING FACTOR-like protein 4 [Hibiscus syriacus]|uniref:Epidermal patterning factor-like protein n=1 Tax=Hibiscus syriacus TaxID=106335 RepID=A0A6A3BC53_HIBSY|nr:EPIDERMAL PATTERNING FACTOR-like protein 4 [Hibiscus syriacus]